MWVMWQVRVRVQTSLLITSIWLFAFAFLSSCTIIIYGLSLFPLSGEYLIRILSHFFSFFLFFRDGRTLVFLGATICSDPEVIPSLLIHKSLIYRSAFCTACFLPTPLNG
jgi:hypothetical protein